jgi:colanic acid biosynthesis glycosyl transferase WcaI
MKVILWGINYAPELTGIGPFNQALCEYLAEQGHEVEVVTGFAYYPEWKKRSSDRRQLFRTDSLNGVRVHRCWLYVPAQVRALRRMLHEASFVALSLLRILSLAKPDVYVVVSPPLSLGVAAWFAGLIKRRPFVFHVQDLQPDAAIGLGMLQKGLLTRLLYGLESFAYSRAARVSGISQGMLQMFRKKGLGKDRIVYFPNGVKLPLELPPRGAFRSRHRIPAESFLAIYSGNLGVKQGLDVLLEAARQLGERESGGGGPHAMSSRPIRIVIAGDGARRAHLAEMIRRFDLGNVLLLPLLPDLEYREMLADADCCVITQQQGTGSFFFPSKLLASLAAAKPVLTVADDDSELARAVHEGRFGVNVLPDQPESLANAIERMAAALPELEAAATPANR